MNEFEFDLLLYAAWLRRASLGIMSHPPTEEMANLLHDLIIGHAVVEAHTEETKQALDLWHREDFPF